MSAWSVLLWNFLPSPHARRNTKFNSSRVFAESGFFLPVPKPTFSQHTSRWHQYFLLVYPLDWAVVDIHSAHAH